MARKAGSSPLLNESDPVSKASAKKPDRGHPVRQRAKHALGLAERIFGDVIRAARSGGQDVRDPFLSPLKIEKLGQSFLYLIVCLGNDRLASK